VLVPAARFLENPDSFLQRQGKAEVKTGVIWPNNRDVDDLVPYLDRLAAVALVFPSFRDGRAYSQARLLRERFQYPRRAPRHRAGAARPVRLHAARRLRCIRGEEAERRRSLAQTVKRYRCSISRPATAVLRPCIGACSSVIPRVPAMNALAHQLPLRPAATDPSRAEELDRALRHASPSEIISAALREVDATSSPSFLLSERNRPRC